MKLSICIPTVAGREKLFNELKEFIEKQINGNKDIEIISIYDNKEMTLGMKRQKMYELCKGKYAWQIDDDDWLHDNAIDLIMSEIDKNMDCITFKELCQYDNQQNKTSNFSLKYKEWANDTDGYNHVRTPFLKCVIKTKLCLKAGVKDIRYAEDHQFAKDIYPLLKNEVHIDEFIYIYRYKHEEHNQKYGIK
jgi:glycosyltransferase involved in cell wall biosynthesis